MAARWCTYRRQGQAQLIANNVSAALVTNYYATLTMQNRTIGRAFNCMLRYIMLSQPQLSLLQRYYPAIHSCHVAKTIRHENSIKLNDFLRTRLQVKW